MQGKCIIFSAPSGAGKTTIIKQLLQHKELRLEFSISATSRKPRGEEKDGVDYYFFTPDEFKNHIKNDNFVEWEEVFTDHFYGTLKNEPQRIWDKQNHVAFDVDVRGGLNLKKLFGDQALAIFVMPPSIEELEKRLRGRGTETEEKINMRISRASYELSLAPQFDMQLVNDSLDRAIQEAYKEILTFISK
jgi:guanylate kinase